MTEPNDFSSDPLPLVRLRYNSFLPLMLLALSLLTILGWELVIGNQARRNGENLHEQQTKMVEQSKKIQVGLEKLARDLIALSQTDTDAKAIVAKYNINVS